MCETLPPCDDIALHVCLPRSPQRSIRLAPDATAAAQEFSHEQRDFNDGCNERNERNEFIQRNECSECKPADER
jgi:hypothetical protein